MKKILPFVILLSALAAFGQDSKAPKGVKVTYDKFKDQTQVQIQGNERPLWYYGIFTHSGKTLSEDQQTFTLSFEGSCRGFCFKDAKLILLIDDWLLNIGVDRGLADTAAFPVPRGVIKELASAKVVEFQVGSFEGVWKAEDLAKFKALLDFGTVKK